MEWLWILPAALLLCGIALYLIARCFLSAFLVRVKDAAEAERNTYERLRANGKGEIADRILAGRAFLATLPYEDVWITAEDGLRLHARYYQNGESRRTALLVHGYRSFGEHDFSCIFPLFRSMGLNFLLIDQRAHGQSEGRYITFGTKERYDVLGWCRYLAARDPGGQILLHGISMGAATVLLAAALPDLPATVVGVLADCGYTSPYDEFAYVMKRRFHLPPFPLLPIADLVSRHRAGFPFRAVNTLDAVASYRLPVLFLHGNADDFVPFENTVRNFAACTSPYKRFVAVEGAGHGLSFLVDEEACTAALADFFSVLPPPPPAK